jgi:hypothetical protein
MGIGQLCDYRGIFAHQIHHSLECDGPFRSQIGPKLPQQYPPSPNHQNFPYIIEAVEMKWITIGNPLKLPDVIEGDELSLHDWQTARELILRGGGGSGGGNGCHYGGYKPDLCFSEPIIFTGSAKMNRCVGGKDHDNTMSSTASPTSATTASAITNIPASPQSPPGPQSSPPTVIDRIADAAFFLHNGLIPIPIALGTKTPSVKAWNLLNKDEAMNTIRREIRINAPNIINLGIQCGAASNLIVLDIDIKDGGMQKWKEII